MHTPLFTEIPLVVTLFIRISSLIPLLEDKGIREKIRCAMSATKGGFTNKGGTHKKIAETT
jgi:hypothetical protein